MTDDPNFKPQIQQGDQPEPVYAQTIQTLEGGMAPEEITPNKVIASPTSRKTIGAVLYTVSVLTGITTIVFLGYPDLVPDGERLISTVNAIVSFLSGAFGIVVTLPNVPGRK